MTPEEIRAEIERRKKLARDMKLSNKVWSLYNSNFQYIDDKLKKDPELILQLSESPRSIPASTTDSPSERNR
jgi:hypothetical protein